MKPIEVENVGVMNILEKSFIGQQKYGKTPFSAINAIFAYFVITIFLKFICIKNKDTEVFKYV